VLTIFSTLAGKGLNIFLKRPETRTSGSKILNKNTYEREGRLQTHSSTHRHSLEILEDTLAKTK
jgi:hypothetical protein